MSEKHFKFKDLKGVYGAIAYFDNKRLQLIDGVQSCSSERHKEFELQVY